MASLRTWWQIAVQLRLVDYLLCVVLGVVAGVAGGAIQPHCRSFDWEDESIQFPYAESSTFPSWTLVPISILPGVVYVVVEGMRLVLERSETAATAEVSSPLSPHSPSYPKEPITGTSVSAGPSSTTGNPGGTGSSNNSNNNNNNNSSNSVSVPINTGNPSYDPNSVKRLRCALRCHFWILTQAFSVTFTMFIVDLCKVYAGRLRPDFLSRLGKLGIDKNNAANFGDLCDKAREGRLSFPSGHSGITFAAVVPLCFFLLSLFGGYPKTLNSNSPPSSPSPSQPSLRQRRLAKTQSSSLWAVLLAVSPLILPITVAISRTRDNRHHFDDVVCGSIIGVMVATVSVLHNFEINNTKGSLQPRLM